MSFRIILDKNNGNMEQPSLPLTRQRFLSSQPSNNTLRWNGLGISVTSN